MWIKDGKKITGKYHSVPYSGTIVSTRVCYGTDIQYTVQLDQPITVFRATRERVLIRKIENAGQFEIEE